MRTRTLCTLLGLPAISAALACATHAGSGTATSGADDSSTSGGSTPAPSVASPAAPAPSGTSDSSIVCTAASGAVAYSTYKTAFFGNLHQHTTNSLDAYTFGTRATPDDAYQFAKGQTSIQVGTGTDAPAGPTVTLDRPLDFLAVTDHSEWLGVRAGCNDSTSPMYSTSQCKAVRSEVPAVQTADFSSMKKDYDALCGTGSATAAACAAEQRTAWDDEQMAAANAYEPCSFTSLIAFEWTSSINGDTNHRNVIFGSTTVPAAPLDSYAYPTRVDLWNGLDQQCTGDCAAFTAPHNSNLSAGVSLTPPASAEEAASMAKYQRLVEIYQHKGDSECYYDPNAPTDPACAFEYVNPGSSSDTPASYVRTALETGLSYTAANGGANPMQLGIMASTDDHNAIAGLVAEDGYVGHLGRLDDTARLRLASETAQQYGSGGLAVVWAEQNTRTSIFSALMRRETYGTSGPRIQVRFYETTSESPCTTDFPKTIVDANEAVPMGGTIGPSQVSGAPIFAVAAWPDASPQPLADGTKGVAGIAMAQIIKAHGTTSITEDAPVDLTVAPQGQCVTWKDPGFNPNELAFYYVRVLQVPTYRWSHFDCQKEPTASGCGQGGKLDVTIQERAWTSPIWYSP